MSLIPRSFYLDDIFDDFNKPHRFNDMKCDIYECEDNYCIEMDIPGYNKAEISIECKDGLLTITANKDKGVSDHEDGRKYIRRERFYGTMSRTFSFTDIDEDSIKAEFNNGCLKVTVPKAKKQETKRVIEIN
ncbi:MAG: Hsp20/alpha crystallin family protein [Candidatus Coprovivens sp.]